GLSPFRDQTSIFGGSSSHPLETMSNSASRAYVKTSFPCNPACTSKSLRMLKDALNPCPPILKLDKRYVQNTINLSENGASSESVRVSPDVAGGCILFWSRTSLSCFKIFLESWIPFIKYSFASLSLAVWANPLIKFIPVILVSIEWYNNPNSMVFNGRLSPMILVPFMYALSVI